MEWTMCTVVTDSVLTSIDFHDPKGSFSFRSGCRPQEDKAC